MIQFSLWILYLVAGGAALFFARWLRRPIPPLSAAVFLLLPIVFCLSGFLSGRTLIPADHVRMLPPWSVPAHPAPHNRNLNDVVTQLAPWAEAVRMAWKEGDLPLRNRWNGCGTALAANGQSAAFSPWTLLALPLPLGAAFTLWAAVHLFLALSGTWLWLRELDISVGSALFGAVVFAFSMTMTPWLLFPLSAVFCLWPWALFAVELLLATGLRRRALAALIAVFACWVLAGHPESAVLGILAIGVFLAVRIGLREGRTVQLLTGVLTAGLLALALTAFLWLPELVAIRASSRYPQAEHFRQRLPVTIAPHLPAWGYNLVTSLFPRALGDDVTSPRIAGVTGSFSEMALGSFGVAAWATALLIFRPGARRPRAEIALAALALCGLAVGTATWPLFDFFLSLPLLRLVLPLRFLSWVSLAGAGIAAFEADRLLRQRLLDRSSLAFLLGAPALLAAAAVVTFLRLRRLHEASGGAVSQRNALVLSLATLAATAAILTFSRGGARVAAAVPLLLACVAGGELFLQGRRLYRWSSAAEVFPPTPLVRFLQSQKGSFRVVGQDSALYPGTNVFAGVEEIRTHDPIERRDYVEFLDRVCGYDAEAYFKELENLEAPALDFLNVRFLVSGDAGRAESARWRRVYQGKDGAVFENRYVLPRVFAPTRLRFVGSPATMESPPPAGDWGGEATVLAPSSVGPGRETVAPNVTVEVLDYRETTNAVRFTARPVGGGSPILVASLVQDGGWSATDEAGRHIPTLVANGVFLGLSPGPGRHEIRLDYMPPGFRGGSTISAVTLVVLLGILAFQMFRTRSRLAPLPTSGFSQAGESVS